MTDASSKIWRFGPFEFNEATSELRRDGKSVSIEPQSLRLLGFLISQRHRVVTRADMVEEIWQGRAVSDWAISGAIKALRSALGDTDTEKRYVRTIHSRGVRFIAPVEAENIDTPAQRKDTVLVRVFRCTGDDTALMYLAEGLAEDLITALSGIKGCRVLSYNTSRALGDATPTINHGVTTIVDGSIRQVGDTIRVNIALLDGIGAHQRWAERFDLTQNTILAGHDLIGQRVIATLTQGDVGAAVSRRGTLNSDAYDCYQKGRYAYFRYEPAAFVEALSHFSKASGLDPSYANAYAQQAYCRTTLYVFGLPGADKTLDKAEALARKAIEVDEGCTLGHARLGWVLGYCGRPDETRDAFEAAMRCDPDNAEVFHAYGETMNRLAQPEKALPLLDAVFSKDSYFPPSWEFPQGHTQALLGEHDAAIGHFRSVLGRLSGFIPARVQLARALWEAGDCVAARQEIQTIKKIAPKYSLAHAARMFPYPVAHEKKRLMDALTASGMI